MNETFTPSKLVERLSGKVNLSNEQLKVFDETLFSIIIRELKKTDSFSIYGFGTFKKSYIKESIGRNPQTGEKLTIQAHYRVKFVPSAKVASRINAEYSHLKPVILEEKPQSKTPSKTTQPEPPTTPTQISKNKTEPESTPISNEEYEQLTKPFSDKKGRTKYLLIIVIILIILFLFIWGNLTKHTTKSNKNNIISREATQTTEFTVTPEISDTVESTTVSCETKTETSKLTTDYKISKNDNFSQLAIEQWNNLCLWPYLYSFNSDKYPDPDILMPNNIIVIPEKPDVKKDRDEIEKSFISAYNCYKTLIQTQITSPKNKTREICIKNVLEEAETLYPGFLEKNKKLFDQAYLDTVFSID